MDQVAKENEDIRLCSKGDVEDEDEEDNYIADEKLPNSLNAILPNEGVRMASAQNERMLEIPI